MHPELIARPLVLPEYMIEKGQQRFVSALADEFRNQSSLSLVAEYPLAPIHSNRPLAW